MHAPARVRRSTPANARSERVRASVAALLLVATGILAHAEGGAAESGDGLACEGLTLIGRADVVRVLDAETLLLGDGRELRLAGLVAPTLPPGAVPGTWPPETAAKTALEEITRGRSLELRHGNRREDRYGRVLAHALLLDGTERRWLQGELLTAGHARADALPGNVECVSEMLAAEKSARKAGRGLWSRATYAVRDAAAVRDLLSRIASFEVVEGRVTSVAARGTRVYLNFGDDWRRDFTAAISASALRREGAAREAEVLALAGKRVRVRGWVERRNGPLVSLSTSRLIELLDTPSQAP